MTTPEIEELKVLIEKKYGKSLCTTTDFEEFSIYLKQKMDKRISASILKRLYGYVSLNPVPRKSTLDILARYIGKRNYDNFCNDLRNDPIFSSSFFSSVTVYSDDLKPGDGLRIGWAPDRVVQLNYLGDGEFEVESSVNGSLFKGDRFRQVSFMLGYPLYVSRILREGEYTQAYVAGRNG